MALRRGRNNFDKTNICVVVKEFHTNSGIDEFTILITAMKYDQK